MISRLAKELYLTNPALNLALLALCIFITVFIGVVMYAWRQKKSTCDYLATLPLSEQTIGECVQRVVSFDSQLSAAKSSSEQST